jgi:hypothetical protein
MCPECGNQLTDEYCKLCGWLSDELLELHERLTRTAAVVRLYGERTPRPGRDAIVIRQGDVD